MNVQQFFALSDDLPDRPTVSAKVPAPELSKTDIPMKSSRSKSGATRERKLLAPLQSRERLSHLVEEIEPRRHRDDLVLSTRNVRIFVGLLEEYRQSDTLRRHGLPVRSKLLFCGPPGCGKTVTAEVFAHELKLPLYVAKLDAIVSSFLGETATNLRKLFEEVNRHPCVLFLDEFDALARSRNDETEHSELRRVVNSLLMLIDRYCGRGFVIAATNLEESLDAAVWRRFDEVILFDTPNDRQIVDFIKLKTKNFPITFDFAEKVPQLRGLSYADVERICLNAIKRSVMRRTKIVVEHEFDAAIRDEKYRQSIKTRLAQSNY